MCFQWPQLVIHGDYCYKNHCFSYFHVCTSFKNTGMLMNILFIPLVYLYMYRHQKTHIYIQICICTCICVYESMCMYTHMHACHTNACIHINENMHKDMCTCPCILIYFWLPCFVPDILETIMEIIIYLSFNFLSIVVYVSSLKCRKLYSARNVCLYLLPSVKLRF